MVAPALPQSAFQPAPTQGGALATTQLNPMQLLEALRDLAPRPAEFAPRYPPGFVKPPKPNPKAVKMRADNLYQDHAAWRNLIELTQQWIRQERTGYFAEDKQDRINGLQEEFIHTFLTTKRNSVIAKVASAKMGVRKRYYADDLRRKCQQIEDAALWLMQEFAEQWQIKGQRDLRIDEALLFADRGMYVSRQVMDPNDPDRPMNIDLIEPTEVYPIWGGKRGMRELYRVRRDTVAGIQADYGDFTKTVRAQIEKKHGKDPSDQTEVNVYEFWDTWHRLIMVDDIPIISAEHEYGYVPWTVQYGGYGEAMFTRTPGDGALRSPGQSYFYQLDRNRIGERAYQAVPLLYYDFRAHEITEAILGRLLTGFKREINPPMERHRSTLLAGTDMPEYSQAPGAINEVALGEEQIKPAVQLANNPITGLLVQTLLGDQAQRSVGLDDKVGQSNVTGAALAQFSGEGHDHILPIFRSLEAAKQHQIGQILQTLGNFGHLIKYGGETTKPLMVPVAKRRQGEAPGFELSRELIEEVGTRIEVTYTRVEPNQWVNLFNAGKLGVELGAVTTEEIRELATGETDFDDHFERWAQQQATKNMLAHPKYNELFLIPSMIEEQIKEAAGDPRLIAFWRDKLDTWLRMAQQSEMQAQQPGMGSAPQPPALGGGNPSPPPPGSTVVAPPVTGGAAAPAGMGPGSQGRPVGRPTG